jgi:hypothetical protein
MPLRPEADAPYSSIDKLLPGRPRVKARTPHGMAPVEMNTAAPICFS